MIAVRWNRGPFVVGPVRVLCWDMQNLWTVSLCFPPWFLHFVPGMSANVHLVGVRFYSTLDLRLSLTLLAM